MNKCYVCKEVLPNKHWCTANKLSWMCKILTSWKEKENKCNRCNNVMPSDHTYLVWSKWETTCMSCETSKREEKDLQHILGKISRLEVIDDSGRIYSNHNLSVHTASIQDKGKTLKIFINDKENEK